MYDVFDEYSARSKRGRANCVGERSLRASEMYIASAGEEEIYVTVLTVTP